MDYKKLISQAIKHFWAVRTKQQKNQGADSGKKDYGTRAAVTGGKHLDGFITLFEKILIDEGLPGKVIHKKTTTLPGFFRPTKKWDLVIVSNNQLLATIEFKAHVGSFGNNFNNRVEEAIGSSTDLLTAYREGKFKPSQRPWLGWLMLLEDSNEAHKTRRIYEPHFKTFNEFQDTSFAKRYELFCEKLIRERLYDSACLLMSNQQDGKKGIFSEPNPEIDFNTFITSLLAKVIAFKRSQKS